MGRRMALPEGIRLAPALLALAWLLGGCGPNTAKVDLAEFRHPLIRKAKLKADAGDNEGALACLNQALESHPGLAQAHLDAGLLYDDYRKDYIRAAYHYQRYLELRPNTEKRAMIEEMIRKDRMSLAAALADQLPGFAEKIKALEAEKAGLQEELRQAREARPVPGAPPAAAEVKAAPAAVKSGPAAARPPGQVYLVQEHDTLSRIAAKVYRDPARWTAIFEANRQTLGAPDKLRPGQSLVIPQP